MYTPISALRLFRSAEAKTSTPKTTRNPHRNQLLTVAPPFFAFAHVLCLIPFVELLLVSCAVLVRGYGDASASCCPKLTPLLLPQFFYYSWSLS